MDKNTRGDGIVEDPKGIYSITEAACDFMEENKDRPFFAYVAHHAIHTVLQTKEETLDHFKSKEPGKQHDNPLCAGCTHDLDDGVGILLAKLKELGLEDQTIVVFTSDNGATGESSQEPLRGNKGCYYEGGIREPFIVRWPGVVKPGTTCDVPVTQIDLYPTFLDAASGTVPEDKILDGESLMPLLTGKGALKRSSIYWHFPGYLDSPVRRGRDPVFRTRPVTVMHRGDWKLFLYHEEWQLDGGREALATNNAVELYNLKDDLGEHHNVANTKVEVRDKLLDEMSAWLKDTGAKMPTEKNPRYSPDAKPSSKKTGKNQEEE